MSHDCTLHAIHGLLIAIRGKTADNNRLNAASLRSLACARFFRTAHGWEYSIVRGRARFGTLAFGQRRLTWTLSAIVPKRQFLCSASMPSRLSVFLYMIKSSEIITDRLILRQWKETDYPLFAKMNANIVVMEFFPDVLSEEESNSLVDKFASLISEYGWGCWAVEIKNTSEFIGFVGLHNTTYEIPKAPFVEVGWRLDKKFWSKGFAREAAEAAIDFAFNSLNLNEVYSFTSLLNKRSIALMKRLNMNDTLNNFKHPKIPEDHILTEHVLYKIKEEDWIQFRNNNS
jgi:ribosomal-protein-alanine N-acetyltransferase